MVIKIVVYINTVAAKCHIISEEELEFKRLTKVNDVAEFGGSLWDSNVYDRFICINFSFGATTGTDDRYGQYHRQIGKVSHCLNF
jgi:hypothetical protein